MNEINKLLSLCNNSVTITVNQHRDFYESVEDYLRDYGNGEVIEETDKAVYAEMVRTNIIVHVQAYPNNATSFYHTFHYDVATAIHNVTIAIENNK